MATEPEKPFPYTMNDWSKVTPHSIENWIDWIANTYVYGNDDGAYDFLSTLSSALYRDGWTYTVRDVDDTVEEKKEEIVMDHALIDIRKFALQKALEAGKFKFEEDEVKSLIKHAKKIEKYLLDTAD
jgi:hypothetical protein